MTPGPDAKAWREAAIQASHREAKAIRYAKTMERVALALFICALILIFGKYL